VNEFSERASSAHPGAGARFFSSLASEAPRKGRPHGGQHFLGAGFIGDDPAGGDRTNTGSRRW